MVDHFLIPFFVSDRFDALLRFPQLYPVRHLGLECLQFLTGIFPAFNTKVHFFFESASAHLTSLVAVKASSFRPAPVAFQFLRRFLNPLRNRIEPFRGPSRADKYRACGAKQPADSGQPLVGHPKTVVDFFQSCPPLQAIIDHHCAMVPGKSYSICGPLPITILPQKYLCLTSAVFFFHFSTPCCFI